MSFLLTFITGSIARYLLIGAVGIGALAWVRHEVRAPLMREIFALHAANANYELIAENDRKRADVAEADLAKVDATLEGLIKDANAKQTACRISPDELKRLQQLASGVR
mgnify:CR=1 FL=1